MENRFVKSLLTVRRQSPNASLAQVMRLWTAAPPFAKGRNNIPLWYLFPAEGRQRGTKGDFHCSRLTLHHEGLFGILGLLQQSHHFHVVRLWEHIDEAESLELISALRKEIKIS